MNEAIRKMIPETADPVLDEFCVKMGQSLKAMRRRKKMSQERAAEEAGVSRYTIFRVESGDMGVAFGTIMKMAKVYDAPQSFFELLSQEPDERRDITHSNGGF